MARWRTLDLFAGPGGLTLGFQQAEVGFAPAFAVEIEWAAARTVERNLHCPVHRGPIEEIKEFGDVDIIVGGPPFRGFESLGRGRENPSRSYTNSLWRHYLRAVRQVKPQAFVFEIAPPFLRSEEFGEFRQRMAADDVLKSYAFASGVLDAADYGVPQHRRCGIIVAVRDADEVPWPPPPTHGVNSPTGAPYVTVRDAIGGLPEYPERSDISVDPDRKQNLHFGRNLTSVAVERYRAIPPGGNRFDLARNQPDLLPRCWRGRPAGSADAMGRLWWDRPSSTIRTEFFKPEKGRYLHPEANRPITHREAALLQSFPSDFEFEGTKIQVARQIGNAVPPCLGAAIGRFVAAQL
ncbi:DNA cytosine methyltransferase [Cryptosporangium aurantiacum]|uniref:DNA (cytosine-5-)-methyltransferase n=1 Tax=Cryptosporangium aurantiacum TaxID=134849 RepID=A0A1M7RJZ0_9ACTN|nr:DNA (cytosine-5)-methyltransferase 1 [Cryptosporangium aurantiacum]